MPQKAARRRQFACELEGVGRNNNARKIGRVFTVDSAKLIMPTYKEKNRPVRIQTPLGEDVLLIRSLSGTERLGRPFHYDLVLASEDHELDYKKIIGQNVTIFVDKGGKQRRFFNGYISRFEQTKYEGRLAEYRATLVPWLWFLTRSSDCRIFQSMTIPEILKQVFEDHGFTDIIERLYGTYRKWDYCVQYRETAYDFVSRLMEEEGIYYYFNHESGKHSLVMCDSPGSHKEFEGYEELTYGPTSTSVVETLDMWVVRHEVQSGAYATTDFDFTTPRKPALANSVQDRGHGQSDLEQFDYLGEQSPFSESERYSKLRLEERQAQHETYSGEGDARGICTGVRFILKGHPRKDFEKEYLTTGVQFQIQATSFETTGKQEDEFKYRAKLTAMPLAEQFRTPRATPKPNVHGPQTAIVVGPAGQKIYSDQYGRVKVQFHWDRRGKSDENSSCWMRVSQAWASKQWGDLALPHVGDEVIVECLEGDPDRPIITGCVYNQANMPPLNLPANQHKRIWQDDYGNRLIFDATPGDEHIRLHTPHHKTGITLGRSACNFTNSNTNTVAVGDVSAAAIGFTLDLYAGGYTEAVLGPAVTPVVGGNYNFTVGPSLNFSYGPQLDRSKGLTYEEHESDFYKVCEKGVLLSAGTMLNLVAAPSPSNKAAGTSVLHANQDCLELSVGEKMEVKSTPYSKLSTAADIAAGILMVAATAFSGAAAGLGGTAPNTDDATASLTMSQQQVEFETVALGVEALSILALILAERVQAASAMELTPVRHGTGPAAAAKFKGRLQLNNTGNSSLESDTSLTLLSNTRKAKITLDGTNVKLEHSTGDIVIQAGTSAIKIANNGAISISGTAVNVMGSNFDAGSGALTVAGTAVATASTLQAEVAKLQMADDLASLDFESLKVDLEIAKVEALLNL